MPNPAVKPRSGPSSHLQPSDIRSVLFDVFNIRLQSPVLHVLWLQTRICTCPQVHRRWYCEGYLWESRTPPELFEQKSLREVGGSFCLGIDGKSIANRLEVNGEEQGITATGGLCRGEFVDACCAPPAEEFVGVCFTPSTGEFAAEKGCGE